MRIAWTSYHATKRGAPGQRRGHITAPSFADARAILLARAAKAGRSKVTLNLVEIVA